MAEGGADGDDDAATASPVQNIYPSYWTPHTVAKFGGAGVALLVAPGAIAGKYFNGEYPSITTASLAGIISGAALAGWNIFGGIWVAMGGGSFVSRDDANVGSRWLYDPGDCMGARRG